MALLGLGHHRRAARPRRDAREAGTGEGERCRAGEGEHLLVVRLLGFWQFGAQKENFTTQASRTRTIQLEGPGYAARRTELRKAKEAARTRDRQAAAPQDETEENDATEEEVTRERATRVGRPRGGMKVAARSGERLRKEIRRGRLPRVGDG